MRGRVARSAFALGSAGLIVLGMTSCSQQSQPSEEAAPTELKIVEQIPIDANGKEIKPPDTATATSETGLATSSSCRTACRVRATG